MKKGCPVDSNLTLLAAGCHPYTDVLPHYDAPSILDTPSILGVSSIFRTPSTESIRILAA